MLILGTYGPTFKFELKALLQHFEQVALLHFGWSRYQWYLNKQKKDLTERLFGKSLKINTKHSALLELICKKL